MRRILACAGIVATLTGLGLVLAQDQQATGTGKPVRASRVAGQRPGVSRSEAPAQRGQEPQTEQEGQDRADDRRAIRNLVRKLQRAYNAHTPQEVRGCFLPAGQWVDETASSLRGAAAIEEACVSLFDREPRTHLSADIEGIWFLGDDLALVQVHALATSAPGQREVHDRISLVCQRTAAGVWEIAVLYDQAGDEGDHQSRLEPLAWILGDWIDESPREAARVHFAWSPGGNSLVGRFHLQIGDQYRGAGEERIGWDPVRKRIRSWIFDADGGYLEGDWHRSGDRWIVKYTGATAAGEVRSSTHELTPIDADHWKWNARDRVIGDVLQPDIADVTVVRRTPPPDLTDE